MAAVLRESPEVVTPDSDTWGKMVIQVNTTSLLRLIVFFVFLYFNYTGYEGLYLQALAPPKYGISHLTCKSRSLGHQINNITISVRIKTLNSTICVVEDLF